MVEAACVHEDPTHIGFRWVSSDLVQGGEVQWYFFILKKNIVAMGLLM
jgi:hypothetical protein